MNKTAGANSRWKTLGGGAHSEDSAADAHVCGPKFDGGLEIVAHPHAQIIKAEFAGKLGQKGKVNSRLLVYRRDAHQAGDI